MSVPFSALTWNNGTTPAINASNLNRIEDVLEVITGSGQASGLEASYIITSGGTQLRPPDGSTKIFTDANDGHGSTLDADTLDTKQLTVFTYQYDAGRTYALNDTCVYLGDIYKSLQATNLNQTPSSSPTYWTLISIGISGATSGYVLTSQGAGSAPTWTNPVLIPTTVASNIASSGKNGCVPYQSADNTTLFTAVGTSGNYLVSGGTGSPTWTNKITIPTSAPGSPVSGDIWIA